MRLAVPVRVWHRRLSLLTGLQLLAWTVGGLVFSLQPIEVVRGEHRRAAPAAPAAGPEQSFVGLDAARRASSLEALGEARLQWLRERWVWSLRPPGESAAPALVDAKTGLRLPPLDASEALAAATRQVPGLGPATDVQAVEIAAGEYRGHDVPAWRVAFADEEHTAVYLHALTGEITAVRTDIWRRFDFFWMLHIMDYGDREDFSHRLLQAAALLGACAAATGLILVITLLVSRRPRP